MFKIFMYSVFNFSLRIFRNLTYAQYLRDKQVYNFESWFTQICLCVWKWILMSIKKKHMLFILKNLFSVTILMVILPILKKIYFVIFLSTSFNVWVIVHRSELSFIFYAFLVNWVCLIERREYLGLPELSIKHIFFVSVEHVLQKFTPADSAQEFQNGRKRWAIVNLICSIFNFVGY